MSITNLSQPDPSRIGFLLLPQEHAYSFFHRFNPNHEFCILDYKCKSVLFTFEGLLSHDLESSFNKTYHVSHPGAYSLYFANCNRQSPVTMDVRTQLYNIDDNGTTKDYLSVGLTHLPSLYLLFSLLYMCFLGFWMFVCFLNSQGFRRIHLVMSALLVITIIQYMCAAADQHYVKVTGIHGFDVLFYILRFITTVLFFNVIVLILGGWCLWEPILQRREKFVLLLLTFFQVLGYGSLILVGEIGAAYNEHWFIYDICYIAFDLYSCIVIFTPIVLEENPEVNKAANSFGIVAFVYVIFTRIIVGGILTQGLVYKCPWVINVVYESSSLAFCMVMFSMFRPSVLEDDDEEGGRMRLLDDQELGFQTSESWILSCISGSYYI